MGHGWGAELISQAGTQGSVRELVTGTILSGCGQLGRRVAGNVLKLAFDASEVSFNLASLKFSSVLLCGLDCNGRETGCIIRRQR